MDDNYLISQIEYLHRQLTVRRKEYERAVQNNAEFDALKPMKQKIKEMEKDLDEYLLQLQLRQRRLVL